MTTREYIIEQYKHAKSQFKYEIDRENDEEGYLLAKQDIYIDTVTSICNLLTSINFANPEVKELYFKGALMKLLQACIIEGKDYRPKTELNEGGYGFLNFPYKKEEQQIMQFLEGFLNCQIPTKDVIWFIELGEKLQIIKLDK